MKKIIFNAPFNNLSFGNVSFNLLREMYKAGLEVTIFPIGANVDLSAYRIDKEFADWMNTSLQNRFKTIKRNIPTLKLWHINGCEQKLSDRQFLYTFYELNRPTNVEINLLKLQDHTFFSSNHARQVFNISGLDDKLCSNVPIGFDEDFHVIDKKYHEDGIIHWGLGGKFEKRKHTKKIIQTWIRKYGNNPKHILSCMVSNPFYKQEQFNLIIKDLLQPFGGKIPANINFINPVRTNAEVNDFLNFSDVDLSGLSGAEGWNLFSFNSCALGKQCVVLNATSHKDWANSENSILVEIDGQEPAADGVFFADGGDFNQGSVYTWDEQEVVAAMEKAESRVKNGVKNIEGWRLQKKFTYKKTLDGILERMK